MPEGGTLVDGLSTNIAFKAINEFGKPADVKGEIKDDNNNTVATFESFHDGMGQLAFTPEPGKKYRAVLAKPAGVRQHFDLPAAAKQGLVMNVSKKGKLLQFNIAVTRDINVKLVGQSKNDVHYLQELSLRKGTQVVEVDAEKFPVGIARFTITTNTRLPLAERLVFLHPDRKLQVKITADKERYQPREKVTLHLKTLDEAGKPVASNFSLAVMDDKLWSLADDKQDHILSWLLMGSELHGKVEEPQFYFKDEEKKAIPALDLVMLTNGYRYFDYIDYLEKTGRPKFSPDLNNIITGVIVDKNGKPVKSTVYLLSSINRYNYDQGEVIQQATADDGVFFFTDITSAFSYHLLASSARKREPVSIKLLREGVDYIPSPARKVKDPFEDDRLPPPLLAERGNKDKVEMMEDVFKEKKQAPNKPDNFAIGKMNDRSLNEVVVVAYNQTTKRMITGSITTVKAQDLTSTDVLSVLQGRVSGLEVTRPTGAGGATIVIRGVSSLPQNDQPLIVLDGVPISKISDIVNREDIDYIEILKDADATAIYGSRGANGVILITSKNNKRPSIVFNLERTDYYASQTVQLKKDQYTIAKHFYAPKYLSPNTTKRDDFRETIYWNPVVQTNKDGDASVEFYNSDANTTFRAIAEGIGFNGKLGRAEKTYAVQSPLTVDAKLPPYMTAGDIVQIPLVIKNNTDKAITAKIDISLSGDIELRPYLDTINIPSDSAVQVPVTVRARTATNGSFSCKVMAGDNKESLYLPVSVTSKGFPVTTTISGNRSKETNFTIHHMLEGTLATELKVFTKMEDRLLSDVEAMLREPYGCFEQTSSTTYPNIYILKLLRSSAKKHTAAEQKAMDYLITGYKRLIGFETAEHGFEWFGRTPPHEALTAYGLLEFTAMNEFIKVDKGMLERTQQFLLGRRDKKGSFNIHKQGLDAFASVPDKIANCYIVYALTASGIKNEIKLEYETAVKKALESNDAYLLSMMALAASNMGRADDFNTLLAAAKEAKLNATTTVVNSRSSSLRVETMALYALALMKEKTPDIGSISNLIADIMKQKSYYGYGSTQGTVLALQAICGYQQLIGDQIAGSQMEIKVNNKTIYAGASATSSINNIVEGENTFSIKYKDEKANAPYQLELAYFTSLPPNDAQAELQLATELSTSQTKVGETVRMQVAVKNIKNILQPMSIVKVGIPAGLTVQPWQLKEMMEQGQIAYYEIFDNYLVLYWMGFAPEETKKVNFDLKAEIAGKYKGKASTTYLYYTPEFKHWNAGTEITIEP
ncbi:TonB-dependent receptor plug domain-containing protein [Chitinophaga pinensis]|uniref:TonB-dependent receptor plug domain-containing protein n=1 Tax=Chitinophaga pinensis TaxID=79329 RepID=UPI0001A2F4BB|nr:TonB-dependent receptor plug domain-containing protein [Chitinophaga pinensis]